MALPAIPAQGLALDARALDGLRRDASADPRAALRQAAGQFEALFMQQLLKSMREAMPKSGMFGGTGHDTYVGMLDQQLSQSLAGRPGGLAETIARQLSRQLAPAGTGAQAAERSTGVPAAFVVGQAALESGWGKHEIKHADGRSAHNLFGIKAGSGWKGATVEVATTEYVDGKAQRTVERFRAYGSYEEAFRDWASLMSANARYAPVLRAGQSVSGYASGMQRAGYATDPRYGEKLERTINQTLMLGRLTT